MTRPDDRDVERLLQAALPATLSPASSACLDAERLAAWAEGGVLADEAAAIDEHVAGCARCQALVAAFVRAGDVAAGVGMATPPKVVPIRRRWHPVWLAPIAAVAAATAWFVWARPVPVAEQPVSQTAIARNEPAPPPMPPPPPAPAAAAAAGLAGATQPGESPRLQQSGADTRRKAADASAPKVGAEANRERRAPAQRADRDQKAEIAGARPAPTAAPAAAPAAAPSPLPAATNAPATPVSQPTPPPSPTPAPQRLNPPAASANETVSVSSGERSFAAAPAAVLEIPTTAMFDRVSGVAVGGVAAGRGGGGGGRGGAAAGRSDNMMIDGVDSRWRVLQGRQVERSVDGGLSWRSVSVELPPNGTLTAGSSPSPDVCWLIGPGGLIRRSTDGARLEAIAPPPGVELANIRATSASEASLTTTDGRVFVTTDAGRTWRPQGF